MCWHGHSTWGLRASCPASCARCDNLPARDLPSQCLDGQGSRIACIPAVPPDYLDLGPSEYENPALDCEGKYDNYCTYCEMVYTREVCPHCAGGIAPALANGDYAPPPDPTSDPVPLCLACGLNGYLTETNDCGEAPRRAPRSS